MPDPRAPSSKIELRMLGGHRTATVREEVPQAALAEAMGRLFQTVMAALREQGVEATSAPFARYHAMGQIVDLEAGVIITDAFRPSNDVKPGELPAGPAAIAVHTGSYESLHLTHEAMERWLEANPGQRPNGGPWELYVTDPSDEPDPNRWMTEVIYPLKRNTEIG